MCAGRITGGLLLGQVASVALLGWSVAQTLQLRRQLTPSQQQTEIPTAAQVKSTIGEQVSKLSLPQRLSQLGKRASGSALAAKDRLQQVTDGAKRQSQPQANNTTAAPESNVPPVTPSVEIIDNRTPTPEPTVDATAPGTIQPSTDTGLTEVVSEPSVTDEEAISQAVEAIAEEPATDTSELHRPDPPDPELVEAAIEDAEEKRQPASPPEPAHDSEQNDKPTG